MEDWQAILAVVGHLIAFVVLAVFIVHDRLSNKNGKVSNQRRNAARVSGRRASGYGHQDREVGSALKASLPRQRSERGQVSLPDHLQKLAQEQQRQRKGGRKTRQENEPMNEQKRNSGLTDTDLAVIIAEATRTD